MEVFEREGPLASHNRDHADCFYQSSYLQCRVVSEAESKHGVRAIGVEVRPRSPACRFNAHDTQAAVCTYPGTRQERALHVSLGHFDALRLKHACLDVCQGCARTDHSMLSSGYQSRMVQCWLKADQEMLSLRLWCISPYGTGAPRCVIAFILWRSIADSVGLRRLISLHRPVIPFLARPLGAVPASTHPASCAPLGMRPHRCGFR